MYYSKTEMLLHLMNIKGKKLETNGERCRKGTRSNTRGTINIIALMAKPTLTQLLIYPIKAL